jgi:metal-responsive CopG/Arc/MetJ family transcriptional regulator
MANIKTAISIDKPLFEQVDDMAHELNTSRSRIFALAATEFIQRHKNLKLLEAINAAYDDFPDVKETSLRSAMRSRHHIMVKDQW